MDELSQQRRQRLEELADEVEMIGRLSKGHNQRPNGKDVESLQSLAWAIKQIARYGTPSFGI